MKNRTEEEDRWSTNYARQLFVILVESDAIYTSQPRMRIRAFGTSKRTRVEEGKQTDAKKKNECVRRVRGRERKRERKANQRKRKSRRVIFFE